MYKLPLTIRHLMAIAMLIMSFQNVMAMGGNAADCENTSSGSDIQLSISASDPHQGHNMAEMEIADAAMDDSCVGNCCCDEPCTDMADSCGNSMQINSLILSNFEFNLSSPVDSFRSINTGLPDLPPLPPIKPPV